MEKELMPKHIAIIMDGNGRWAQQRGLIRTAGHKEGAANIKRIAIEANKIGIKVMTVYAFSTENWKRPFNEVDYLCKAPRIFFKSYMKDLQKNNIRVMYIGELDRFPEDTRNVINRACEETKTNTGLILCLASNYGSRREIVLGIKKYTNEVVTNKRANDLEENEFDNYLMTSQFPEVDLMIRTSGELRLSNFLLWQLSYSELMFVEEAWPDFNEEVLHRCIDEYENRNRRFGGI